ncbi:MAG: transporter substrate-binding domain-containing protein [Thermoleophilia bacterium]
MVKGKFYLVLAALLIGVLGVVGIVAGCGESGASTEPDSSSTAEIEGTAMERATAILGHEPTGKALDVINRGTMTVNNDPKYPPQSSIDETTGELVGFDVDVAKRVGEILGLKVEFTDLSFDTILTDVNQDRYDVSIGSMTITPARAKKVDFTDVYYYTPAGIVVKEGGTQITGVDDLAGKKVGVAAGTTYLQWLQENSKAKPVIYATDADAFPDLAQDNGRIDFAFTAVPTAIEAIRQGQPFELSGDPLYYEDLAFAIKKGEADWLALLNYSIQTMHEDGSLTDMSKTWYVGVDLTKKAE